MSIGHDARATRSSPLRLVSGEVHVWCARLDVPPETASRLFATLAGEERERSARFRNQRDRQHFIVAHGVLRELLGGYLEIPPERVRYVHNAFGKPDLSPEWGGWLKFNLSHAAGLALIAIAAEASVGVDVECLRGRSGDAEVARLFFSAAEVEQLSALPRQRFGEAFLSHWTKKEAYVKACGDGLGIPLNGFTVPLTADRAQGPTEVDLDGYGPVPARRWSFHTLQPARGFVGALAIEGTGWRLSHRQWEMRQT